MSYDIYLELDCGNPHTCDETCNWDCPLSCSHTAFETNYTSNVSPMWAAALGRSLREFDGAPATEAAGPLTAALARMEAYPETYRAMNPANGWGDYDGALRVLRELAEACALHPRGKIVIST